MIEAALLTDGFGREEVAIVHPYDLAKVVGPETELCGITGHDLLGINPPTSTFTDFTRRGPPFNRIKFLDLLKDKNLKGLEIVVGGKSAWQVASIDIMDRLGIDYVHLGEGELSVPQMFRSILEGKEIPRIVKGEDVPVEAIPNLRGATIHGLVEISRGCGRGCAFCTPGMQKVRHKAIDHIERDIRTEVEGGCKDIILHSEDALRYGTSRIEADEKKVIDLVTRACSVEGVNSIGFSHIALASAYHHPHLIEKISEIGLTMPGNEFVGAQTGLETGSTKLMRLHMQGKTLPSPSEKWKEIATESLGLLKDNHWLILSTLVAGLPGEKEEDVLQTSELLDDLKDSATFIVPMCFVSMAGARLSDAESFTVDKMTPAHWVMFGQCLQHDIELGRKLKDVILPSNPMTHAIGGFFLNRFLKGAEKYSKVMLKGQPPRDYLPDEKNFRNPEIY